MVYGAISFYSICLVTLFVNNDGYLDVKERLLCLHFDIEPGPLVIIERMEYDEDMELMQTILQRHPTCISRWLYRVTPRYYKVISLSNPLPGFQQSTHTPQLGSSLNRPNSFQSKPRLRTIVEIPEIKVHCLSFDFESRNEVVFDDRNEIDGVKIEATACDNLSLGSGDAKRFDSRYPNQLLKYKVIVDGDVKTEEDFVEILLPTQSTTSEETIRVCHWLALTHGLAIPSGHSDFVASNTLTECTISESKIESSPQSVLIGSSGP